jgi:hypothetical protein
VSRAISPTTDQRWERVNGSARVLVARSHARCAWQLSARGLHPLGPGVRHHTEFAGDQKLRQLSVSCKLMGRATFLGCNAADRTPRVLLPRGGGLLVGAADTYSGSIGGSLRKTVAAHLNSNLAARRPAFFPLLGSDGVSRIQRVTIARILPPLSRRASPAPVSFPSEVEHAARAEPGRRTRTTTS